jgi:nitrate reductase delta subunit
MAEQHANGGDVMLIVRALGRLLTYPTAELIEALPEIHAAVAESSLPPPHVAGVSDFIEAVAGGDLLELQETYVNLFDRNRRLSLHLYEHVHGEARERGQAMVRLLTIYKLHGFEPDVRELPDFLPMFCEFLSLIPERAARHMLGDAATVLELLRERLAKRGSPYASVMTALLGLSSQQVDRTLLERISQGVDDDPSDLNALDEAWEEAPVTFGPDSVSVAACRPAHPSHATE